MPVDSTSSSACVRECGATETQPAGFLDGKDTIGTPGGTTTDDKFSAIVLNSNVNGTENNFGEVKSASLSGYVYSDLNNDGSRTGELGIAGATVTLTWYFDDLGAPVNSIATTNASGYYEFYWPATRVHTP